MKPMTYVSAAVAIATVALSGTALADVKADVDRCNALTAPADARKAVGVCTHAMRGDLISDKVRVNMLVNRGNALRSLGEFEGALQDLSTALAIGGPRAFDAWYGRGLARSALGDQERAMVDFTRALEIEPQSAKVFVARGNASAANSDYPSAVEDYDRALSVNPNFTDAHYARGTANNRLGNVDAAVSDYERAMDTGGRGTVLALQSYLKANGVYTGELDGEYGPGMKAALRACVEDPNC